MFLDCQTVNGLFSLSTFMCFESSVLLVVTSPLFPCLIACTLCSLSVSVQSKPVFALCSIPLLYFGFEYEVLICV